MSEVSTSEVPGRSLLCLKRNVAGHQGEWALGKEFVVVLPSLPPDHGGPRWSRLIALLGEVSDDSHGPIEWCRPVPDDQAHALAVKVPELALRTGPAHREAFVHPGGP